MKLQCSMSSFGESGDLESVCPFRWVAAKGHTWICNHHVAEPNHEVDSPHCVLATKQGNIGELLARTLRSARSKKTNRAAHLPLALCYSAARPPKITTRVGGSRVEQIRGGVRHKHRLSASHMIRSGAQGPLAPGV